MNITLNRSFLIGLVLLSGACAGTNEKDNLKEVDTLVARIERTHVELELSKERVRQAVGSLRKIASPDFSGDPVVAYGDFVGAVEASEEQAEVLRKSIGPMKSSADKVYARWKEDLEVFENPGMRMRSEERLRATQERFNAIVSSLEPTVDSFDAFNQNLRDHVLFLQHDFNPAAVQSIGGEVKSLGEHAQRLDANLDVCLTTTLAYVRSTALPGELADAGQ